MRNFEDASEAIRIVDVGRVFNEAGDDYAMKVFGIGRLARPNVVDDWHRICVRARTLTLCQMSVCIVAISAICSVFCFVANKSSHV